MKVLLITRGGIDSEKLIGNFELDQAIALKKCNIDVRVLSLDIRRKISYNESDSRYINYMGISIYCYKLGKVSRILPFSVKSSISQWKMLRCFKNITQNWRPDLVHAHFGDVAYQALKIKKANNILRDLKFKSSIVDLKLSCPVIIDNNDYNKFIIKSVNSLISSNDIII